MPHEDIDGYLKYIINSIAVQSWLKMTYGSKRICRNFEDNRFRV